MRFVAGSSLSPRSLTFLVWVESKVCIKLLMALFLHNGLAEDGILMNDVDRLLLLLLF